MYMVLIAQLVNFTVNDEAHVHFQVEGNYTQQLYTSLLLEQLQESAWNYNGWMLIVGVLLTMLTSACYAVSNAPGSEIALLHYHPGI